jgi:hypothetical protein
MSKTPGQILIDILNEVKQGGDPEILMKEMSKETCKFFSSSGIKVTCGEYESSDGGKK